MKTLGFYALSLATLVTFTGCVDQKAAKKSYDKPVIGKQQEVIDELHNSSAEKITVTVTYKDKKKVVIEMTPEAFIECVINSALSNCDLDEIYE